MNRRVKRGDWVQDAYDPPMALKYIVFILFMSWWYWPAMAYYLVVEYREDKRAEFEKFRKGIKD